MLGAKWSLALVCLDLVPASFTCYPVLETLVEFLDPSVPRFPHLRNGNDNSDFQLELQVE